MPNLDPLILHQCSFRTGAWQCGWGEYAKQSQAFVLCPIHAETLKRAVTDMSGVLSILLAERAAAHAANAPEDFFDEGMIVEWKRLRWTECLTREDAILHLTRVPFHWRPIEDCWHLLTGQALPDCAESLIARHTTHPATAGGHRC